MKEFILEDNFDLGSAKIDYAKKLNPEQIDVVLHGEGSCLVLAGAGSGKTRTITYRVAYLLERGVMPENILLLTFTNKAAKEMMGRVEALLGKPPHGLWGGTFHSVANRILRTYATSVGRSQRFTILDEEDSKSLVKSCVKAVGVDTTARRFPSPANLHAIASYARNSGSTIPKVVEARYPSFGSFLPSIQSIIDLYETRKQEADAMDFDDLLLKLRELVYSHDDIRQRLATQFQYILVDEFQDTNVVQADIVRQLASVHGNVLVVGDDAQSIYSFRAAEIRNILNFPDTYSNTKVFRLTTNYRSTPEILAVANASIHENKDQFEKKLKAVCGSLERPCLVPAGTAQQEAQYIAQQISTLRREGVAPQEIAVLFRAAFHSQALEFELMKRGVAYEYRGGMKFFQRAHVKDVVAHLRVRLNPKDEVAWMRALGLLNGIGLATAEGIARQVRDAETLEHVIAMPIKIPSRAQAGWETFKRTLTKIAREDSPSELIRSIIALDYQDYLQAEYPDFADRLEDLEQFALFAEDYTDLKTFLDEVSLSADYEGERGERSGNREQGTVNREQGGGREERMVLSTVHQAKGLEWDAVFVMHLVDGKFPNERALNEDGGLEEERRLFYVATTRARKHLFFTYPVMSGYDTLELNQPSMFLAELPDELLESVKIKHSMAGTRRWDEDEPTIVLDARGERIGKETMEGKSFLRGIDEL
jgi:DNA helicase-2/ATP-dependent DNA helicase PcrA